MPVELADGALILAMLMIILAAACRLAIQVEKRRLNRLFNLARRAVYGACSTCHDGTCSTRNAGGAR